MVDMQKLAEKIALAPGQATKKQNHTVYEAYQHALTLAVELDECGHSDRMLRALLVTMWMHPAYAGADYVCLGCGHPCAADWQEVYDDHPEFPSGWEYRSTDQCTQRVFERGE